MNIGDAVSVVWAGESMKGEVIGFDRGETVVAFDAIAKNGRTTRMYQSFRDFELTSASPARYDRRKADLHAEFRREALDGDVIARNRRSA